MGPRPRGRGKCKEILARALSAAAQWGRARAGAEREHRALDQATWQGFDGAARARARKGEWSSGRVTSSKLQGGRAGAGAERLALVISSPWPWKASMGPRPRGRGKWVAGSAEHNGRISASMGPRPRGRGKYL